MLYMISFEEVTITDFMGTIIFYYIIIKSGETIWIFFANN